MEEEKKEEPEETSLAWMFTLIAVTIMLIVGSSLYQYISEPYRTADELRDILDSKEGVSDDYCNGWNDCVDYYFKMKTEPTNMTSGEP